LVPPGPFGVAPVAMAAPLPPAVPVAVAAKPPKPAVAMANKPPPVVK
jgi:hypothetical protein